MTINAHTANDRLLAYLHRLEFSSDINATKVYRDFWRYMATLIIFMYTKNDLRVFLKSYLRKLSFYSDIDVQGTYAYINTHIITPMVIVY